jgi:hypothetical protein
MLLRPALSNVLRVEASTRYTIDLWSKGISVTQEVRAQSGSRSLPYDRLRAAVAAVAELRDEARLLVFLSPGGGVKLIGDKEEFLKAYARHVGQPEASEAESAKARDEVRQLLTAHLSFGGSPEFVERTLYAEDLAGATGEEKENLRQQLKDKLQLVSDRLVTNAIRERRNRLDTSGADCLDDVDVELVSERLVRASDTSVIGPYLKLSHVVAEKKEGEVVLQESHTGVVVAVLGNEVAVQYRVGDRYIEQVYERGQFVNGKLPNVGDVLEACVLVLRKPIDENRPDRELSDEFGSFQRRGVKGPFKI